MPYNPGVQDISGQLLAQGMMNRTQGITSAIKDFAKNEDDRQKTVAAVKGMLMDPYFQQQISTDPTMLATAEKVKSGNARLNDVQAFLGTLTTMQHGREEELKRQQMEVQKQYNDALREQAIAQTASMDAATKMKERMDREATANATFIKDAMRNKPADSNSLQVFQDYIARGGTPTEEAVRMFGGMMGAEGQMGVTEQRARAAELRSESATLAAQQKEAAMQRALDAKAAKPMDPKMQAYLNQIDEMVQNGELTKEEARDVRRKYVMNEAQRGNSSPYSFFPPQNPSSTPTTPPKPSTETQSQYKQVRRGPTAQADYEAVKSGETYLDPNGTLRVKP